jgi:predicted Zn-dependent protease
VLLVLILGLILPIGLTSLAGKSVAQTALIRDAEIEHSIRMYAAPLFEAAGLPMDDVRVHIVASSELNAFVTRGQNIFFNTGLLLTSESSGEILGVLAHEIGHILAGHLSGRREAIDSASAQVAIAMLLGIAAMASGQVDAGAAITLGGGHVAQQSLLKYSRTQESIADQTAITLLRQSGYSPAGLLAMMERLRNQEALVTSRQDTYVRSHPLPRDRIGSLRAAVAKAPPGRDLADFDAALARLQAKIYAFTERPGRTFRRYPQSDTSVAARYARAIAYHRDADRSKALETIDALLADFPTDPYFHELKGQILFEQGRAADAVPALRRAVELLPNQPLILLALGQAEVDAENPALNRRAIGHLQVAVEREPRLAAAWRQLAIATGRDGRMAASALASAEYALLTRRPKNARMFAARAAKQLPAGSPGALRAQDILSALDRTKKNRQKANFR